MSLDKIRLTIEQARFLFRRMKFDRKRNKWKRITYAQREFKKQFKRSISRPTIYKLIAMYPQGIREKPKKITPRFYQEFERTEIAEKIKSFYWDAKIKGLSKRGKSVLSTARKGWKARNKRDPMYWSEKDYLFFWGTPTQAPFPEFIDPQTNKISFENASSLRMVMALSKRLDLRDDPRFTTKGLKRKKGRRKKWYLDTEEIVKVINVIMECDTLILFLLGILLGGRFSALRRVKVSDIDRQAKIIDVYEPKVKKTVEKPMLDSVLSFIWRYIVDFNIKGKMFHWSISVYNDRLRKASKDAGLPQEKTITTHMLKHTCITQMSLHGVDIDVISDYTGTEATTILDFYRGGGDKKIRAQVLGLAYEYEPWHKYIPRLLAQFKRRYNYIKAYSKKVDGIRLRRGKK